MKNAIIFFICLIIGHLGFSQSYGANLGLRLGNNNTSRTIGVTGQYRIDKRITLEGIIQTDFSRNTSLHLMIQKHRGFISKRFNAYFGGGISLGSEETSSQISESNQIITTVGNKTFGVDAILGIEMTLLKYTISFDYKPNLNITGRKEWYRGQAGFSVRKVLLTGGKQNRNKRKRKRARKKKLKAKKKA